MISLPTSSGTARVRLWRALKSLECVALRDGAYRLLADLNEPTHCAGSATSAATKAAAPG